MANNFTFKDASAATQTAKSTDTASVHTPHLNVDTLIGSSIAHDAADSGSPHKIGAKATTSLAGETMVATADRTDLRAGVDGVLITRPYCNPEDIVSATASNTDGSSTSCIAAQGSGIKVHITTIVIANTSSTSIVVDIKENATTRVTLPVPANGGVTVTFPVPLCPVTANLAWNFDPSSAVSTTYCSMVGYKSKI